MNFSWGIGTDYDSILFYLPAYLNKLGTKNQTASDFKKSLFELGAAMNFSSSENKLTLSVEGIDSKINETFNLVNEFLTTYLVSEKAIKNMAAMKRVLRIGLYSNRNFMRFELFFKKD